MQLLESEGVEVEVVEYLNEVPTKEELKNILAMLGLKAEAIVRKGEPVYKEKFKGKTMTNAQWITAMVKYPKLIERPIVVKGNEAVLGRPPQNVLTLIGKA